MNADTFWSQVEKHSNCWIWIGKVTQRGYGFCDTPLERAHRKAWELTHGAIPKRMSICHRCDVRNCVNPDHLFIGTHADNNRDMCAKGRSVNLNGQNHGNSKLKLDQVIEIKLRAKLGNYSLLGREFGVSAEQISRIANGERWKHIAKVKEGK